jgi:hypothetical protein
LSLSAIARQRIVHFQSLPMLLSSALRDKYNKYLGALRFNATGD